MARQAEAAREKRAKIINAEGESLAAAALGDASGIMMTHPLALQLRNLQSLVEIGVDKNTIVVFPAPLMTTIAELGSFLARESAAAETSFTRHQSDRHDAAGSPHRPGCRPRRSGSPWAGLAPGPGQHAEPLAAQPAGRRAPRRAPGTAGFDRLLGTGLSLSQVVHVGGTSLPVMLGTLAIALGSAWIFGRLLNVDTDTWMLIGVGTGIEVVPPLVELRWRSS